MVPEPRKLLLDLYRQGLVAVDGRRCVQQWLKAHPPEGPFHLVALGKAADAMTAGALDAIAPSLVAGLLVTRHGYLETPVYRDPRLLSLEAGHPLPDEHSLAAGNALALFLQQAPADARFLFLISGGASSSVEIPVAGVSLEQLRRLNLWLLGSGLAIGDMNRVRGALSRIKGGRLAALLKGRKASVLLMSDVPGDTPADIGSGLLIPQAPHPLPELPAEFTSLPFQRDAVAASTDVEAHVIASNAMAREAIAAAARAAGIEPRLHDELPVTDAAACGEALVESLRAATSGVHIWGGETTVKLPAHPGQGGRNQQLALAAARRLAGARDMLLLAAGSDGSDGVSDDAGALVDGGTLSRGEDGGYDAADCLRRADAAAFLEASGDIIHTGPTGTNVMDIVIGYKG
jgi:hydroxypyruvate reductase